MSEHDKVKNAILDFVKGGDTSDVNLLDKVLHPDFRVTNNGFMGKPGVTIITREQYLNNIKTGVFGGLPRKVSVDHIDISGTIATAKISLESSENTFVSYNSMVLDTNGEWRLVNNLAVVTTKS